MRSSPEHVRQIISQWFPDHSEAARYWDSLKPEWRGVVLHAASVYGHEALNASLAKCNWCELYARLDHRRMMQLRAGTVMRFSAGLPATLSAPSPRKKVLCAFLCVSWPGCLKSRGHARFSIPPYGKSLPG